MGNRARSSLCHRHYLTPSEYGLASAQINSRGQWCAHMLNNHLYELLRSLFRGMRAPSSKEFGRKCGPIPPESTQGFPVLLQSDP